MRRIADAPQPLQSCCRVVDAAPLAPLGDSHEAADSAPQPGRPCEGAPRARRLATECRGRRHPVRLPRGGGQRAGCAATLARAGVADLGDPADRVSTPWSELRPGATT